MSGGSHELGESRWVRGREQVPGKGLVAKLSCLETVSVGELLPGVPGRGQLSGLQTLLPGLPRLVTLCSQLLSFPILATARVLRAYMEGWKFYRGNLYYFSEDKKSWHQAEQFCVSQGTHLASVTSGEEQVRVAYSPGLGQVRAACGSGLGQVNAVRGPGLQQVRAAHRPGLVCMRAV